MKPKSVIYIPKGGELRDTKTLNLSRNFVSLQVLDRCFAFFTLSRKKKNCWELKKVAAKRRARIYFGFAALFFIKLTTFHATNLLMLRDKLRVFVSHFSPPGKTTFFSYGRSGPRLLHTTLSATTPGNNKTLSLGFQGALNITL